MARKMPTRVLIVDENEGFRELLKRLLGESVKVVGEAADGEEAVRLAQEQHPELVLLDIGLPGLGGIEVTRQIKADQPATKVILLTALQEEAYLSATGKSGADALLPKQAVRTDLVSTIRSVKPDYSRHWNGKERRRKPTGRRTETDRRRGPLGGAGPG